MLVLSGKVGEKIQIGNNITITILEIRGSKVRIGIEAPPDVLVRRDDSQTPKHGTADEPHFQDRAPLEPFQDQRLGRDCFWCTTIDNIHPTG